MLQGVIQITKNVILVTIKNQFIFMISFSNVIVCGDIEKSLFQEQTNWVAMKNFRLYTGKSRPSAKGISA